MVTIHAMEMEINYSLSAYGSAADVVVDGVGNIAPVQNLSLYVTVLEHADVKQEVTRRLLKWDASHNVAFPYHTIACPQQLQIGRNCMMPRVKGLIHNEHKQQQCRITTTQNESQHAALSD